MSIKCAPISVATVHLVLAHISPLEGSLPPHLVSRPLLQRHHFLGLTPENAAEYLAWPSSEQSHVVELLQTQALPSHDEHLIIHYTTDTENLTAHIRITPDLRLLFLWDNQNGWQYHNVDLMPFPSNSYTNFSDAFAAYSPDDFLPEPQYAVTAPDDGDGDDDDSYWNAYGQGDEDHPPPSSRSAKETKDLNSEDAYWAQYSSVQGSGDSTLPSPRPLNKKLASDVEVGLGEGPERIFVPSDDFQIHHVEPYNPLEPPAPDSLARRLAALSALQTEPGSELRMSPPLFEDDSPTSDSNTASPHLAELLPPPEVPSPTYSPFVVAELPLESALEDPRQLEHPSQELLRDNVKCLYRLWKFGRQDAATEQDKEVFLATVRQALEQL